MSTVTAVLVATVLLLHHQALAQKPSSAPWDFTRFPALDKPPPTQQAWDDFYKISSGNPQLAAIPVKLPYNSASVYPICPGNQDPASPTFSCDWSCYNCTRARDVLACQNPKYWALSYDDGPSNNTIPILDALAKTNSKATFCVIGSRVADHPDILRRIHNEGHTLCVHTWSHRYLTSQSNSQILAEFQWAIQAVEYVTGVRPVYARPPFGDMDDRVRYIFQQMSLIPLLWSQDCYDWKSSNPNEKYDISWIPGNFTQWIKNDMLPGGGIGAYGYGPMSLEHDLYWQTAEAALPIIPMILQAGYKLVNAATCIPTQATYVAQGVVAINGAMYVGASVSIWLAAFLAFVSCVFLWV